MRKTVEKKEIKEKSIDEGKKKKECPHCHKFLSQKYLNTHIKMQHNDINDKEDVRNYTVPANLLANIDISEFELMASEEDELVAKMFELNLNKEKPKRDQPERRIQKKLEKQLNGGHRTTPIGIIDIITDEQGGVLCEIKHWDCWKHALGQLLAYSWYYPKHMLRMHLFGEIPSEEKRLIIINICTHYRIQVTYEKNQ